MFSGEHILITGGTGSLGKAVLKRAKEENWDATFTIFSRDETKQAQLRSLYPEHKYVLGSVANEEDLERAMHGVDIIFHFAAYKQVPSSQVNVNATMNTNVIGSKNVAKLAVRHNVKKVVATSTDKASAPVNYYGASKMMMEGIFQEANSWGNTKFTLTRYGNVICSNASVIPLFIRQKASGGPLTVTDFNMTRFWISLHEATNLVLLALDAKPGVIVVPKAPAMGVGDLAVAMANGLVVEEIGIRPGEKIHECMVTEAESLHTDEDDDHYYIYPSISSTIINEESFSYTSDTAKWFLSWNEMKEMIEDAGYEL